MNEPMEKYLPIGTVVLLKGATKRVMITGFSSISPDTGKRIFDYSGCTYPEGFFDYNQVCVFDHNQIEKVFFKGFVDNEELTFKEELKKKIAELQNQQTEV